MKKNKPLIIKNIETAVKVVREDLLALRGKGKKLADKPGSVLHKCKDSHSSRHRVTPMLKQPTR